MVLERQKKHTCGRAAKKIGTETVGHLGANVTNVAKNWVTQLTSVYKKCYFRPGVGEREADLVWGGVRCAWWRIETLALDDGRGVRRFVRRRGRLW